MVAVGHHENGQLVGIGQCLSSQLCIFCGCGRCGFQDQCIGRDSGSLGDRCCGMGFRGGKPSDPSSQNDQRSGAVVPQGYGVLGSSPQCPGGCAVRPNGAPGHDQRIERSRVCFPVSKAVQEHSDRKPCAREQQPQHQSKSAS